MRQKCSLPLMVPIWLIFLVISTMGAEICLLERELIGLDTGEMVEIISEPEKPWDKPGRFDRLEFCNVIEEDGSTGNMVMIRARLKFHEKDVGIVVDDISLTNEACMFNTTCIDAQTELTGATSFDCLASLNDCAASLACTKIDKKPNIKQFEGFVCSEDGSFSALSLTKANSDQFVLGGDTAAENDEVVSTGSAFDLTAPVIGLRAYHDSVSINGVQLLSDECICKHATFKFDGEDELNTWPSFRYVVDDPPITITWTLVYNTTHEEMINFPDMNAKCEFQELKSKCANQGHMACELIGYNQLNFAYVWWNDIEKSFKEELVANYNDGFQSKTWKNIKLNTPCTNGWEQYPDIPTEYHIEFGQKFRFNLVAPRSYDEALMPDHCHVEARLRYHQQNELADLRYLSDDTLQLTIGSSVHAFYPSYSFYINIWQSNVDTWHKIDVYFTTAPTYHQDIASNQGKQVCLKTLEISSFFSHDGDREWTLPKSGYDDYTILAAKGARLQFWDLYRHDWRQIIQIGFDDGTTFRHAEDSYAVPDAEGVYNYGKCNNVCGVDKNELESWREFQDCTYDFRGCFSKSHHFKTVTITREESNLINRFALSWAETHKQTWWWTEGFNFWDTREWTRFGFERGGKRFRSVYFGDPIIGFYLQVREPLMYYMTPIVDTCQCYLGANLDPGAITELMVEVDEEFIIEPFSFEWNGFRDCNATALYVELLTSIGDGLNQVKLFDYSQGLDRNNRTVIFKALDKQIFNHNHEEILKFDIKMSFVDGTDLKTSILMDLTETLVCASNITFAGYEQTGQLPMLYVKTGEYLKIKRPVASQNATESLRSDDKCKIGYKLFQDEEFPIFEMEEWNDREDSNLIYGTNNTALIGVHSATLFAYYEHYLQQLETHSTEIEILVNVTLGDDPGVLGRINAPPILTQPLEKEKYTVEVGQEWSAYLGQNADADDDTVSVSLTCITCQEIASEKEEEEKQFLKLVEESTKKEGEEVVDGQPEIFNYHLVIEKGSTTQQDLGSYDFELVAKDAFGNTTYPFRISIKTPEQIEIDDELVILAKQKTEKEKKPQQQVVQNSFPGVVVEKREPPPGKRLPMTPAQFLQSLDFGDSGSENEKDPMKKVGNFISKEFKENQSRDASASRNEKPPDLRVQEVSAEGELNMSFTSEMEDIPSDDLIKAISDERRRLESEATDGLKIDLIYFPGVEDPMKADVMLFWELKNITKAGVVIQISFDYPQEVSQDEEADFALIKIEGFDRFKDVKGKRLPAKIVKKVSLPAQFGSPEEAQTVQSITVTGSTASKTVIASNFGVNLLLVSSISQLWSAVNGLQILVYMPLFWVKFPANASMFNTFLIDIATFEVVPSDEISGKVLVLPEDEPYNINFQQSRIESGYALKNVGTILYVFMGYTAVIITERIWALLLKKLQCCRCQRSTSCHQKIHAFLYWGALNTLAMEVYLDVGISATLNVHTMKWLENNPDLVITNIFAILCTVFIAVYPIWLLAFYCKKHDQWKDETFQKRFGSTLEGTKYKSQKSGRCLPMVQPVVFVIRRSCFIFAVIVISEFLWMQLFIQFLFSIFMVIYLAQFQPLESRFTNRMEILNECTCIVLMYHIMCFSDFVPEASTRSGLGISFIVVIFMNVAVHLFFMIKDNYFKTKQTIMRKCCYERWHRNALKLQAQRREKIQKALEQNQNALTYIRSQFKKSNLAVITEAEAKEEVDDKSPQLAAKLADLDKLDISSDADLEAEQQPAASNRLKNEPSKLLKPYQEEPQQPLQSQRSSFSAGSEAHLKDDGKLLKSDKTSVLDENVSKITASDLLENLTIPKKMDWQKEIEELEKELDLHTISEDAGEEDEKEDNLEYYTKTPQAKRNTTNLVFGFQTPKAKRETAVPSVIEKNLLTFDTTMKYNQASRQEVDDMIRDLQIMEEVPEVKDNQEKIQVRKPPQRKSDSEKNVNKRSLKKKARKPRD